MSRRLTATCIVFDCDGVLADSEDAWFEAEAELCRQWGLERSEYPSTHGLSMRDTVRVLLGNRAGAHEAQAEAQLVGIAAQVVPARVRALPMAAQAVDLAAGRAPVVVASNSPRAVLTPVLEAIGVTAAISGSVAGDEVAAGKPHPAIYRAAVDLVAASPATAIAFEDSPAGARSAAAAGIRVVQVRIDGVPDFAEASDAVSGLAEVIGDPDRFFTWDR